MSAAVEQRLARFRAARGTSSAATRLPPRSEKPPGKAAAPEASEGPDRGGQPRPVPAATEPARPLLVLALKVLLWAVLLALFAELELGLPFFVVSLLYWMYAGTRGPGERRPGELSAYSVFNPGCTPIAGTLTAEQLERELHYRPAAGR